MTKKKVKITKFCDRCKKEVENFETSFAIKFPVRDIFGNVVLSENRVVDLCSECADKLKKFLDNKETD